MRPASTITGTTSAGGKTSSMSRVRVAWWPTTVSCTMVTRFSCWCNDSVNWCISSWDTSSRSSTKRVSISSCPHARLSFCLISPSSPSASGARDVGRCSMCSSASSINPRIAVSGVRSSWLTMRRNSCLRRSAAFCSEMSRVTPSAIRRS